jgi:hypothetical protein
MFMRTNPEVKQMSAYRFSVLPSNSSVAATVTLLVTGWFALAGCAILTDNHSAANIAAARATPVTTAVYDIPAEAKLTIVVEARRSRATL